MRQGATLLTAALVSILPLAAAAQPVFDGTEVRITSDLGQQYDPSISGDLLVFTSFDGVDSDVWYHDLATGEQVQVTQSAGDQELTDVSEGRIAYTDYGSADVVVYSTLDGSTTNLTEAAGSVSLNPAIGGPIVAWEERRDGNPEIYARDLSTGEERRITRSPTEADLKPAVGGGLIAWQACAGSLCDIRTYDWATGATGSLSSSPEGDERRPDVEEGGGVVVFDAIRGGEQDVYYFDLATGIEKRLALPGEQINPNVSGEFVAFEEMIDGGYHIKLWHVPSDSVFGVTTSSAGFQYLNDLDGNRVVYTDDRNGHLDIYLYEFSLVFPPPPVADCASAVASGATPLMDELFRRGRGAPAVVTIAFAAQPGRGLLCVENAPEGAFPVVSAKLSLNEQALLDAEEFVDANGLPLPSIEREVSLLSGNLLTARLAGKPGSAIRVRVFALGGEPGFAGAVDAPPSRWQGSAARLAAGLSGVAAVGTDGAQLEGFGCSQSGSGAWGLAALLVLLAFLPRPRMAALRVRSRDQR